MNGSDLPSAAGEATTISAETTKSVVGTDEEPKDDQKPPPNEEVMASKKADDDDEAEAPSPPEIVVKARSGKKLWMLWRHVWRAHLALRGDGSEDTLARRADVAWGLHAASPSLGGAGQSLSRGGRFTAYEASLVAAVLRRNRLVTLRLSGLSRHVTAATAGGAGGAEPTAGGGEPLFDAIAAALPECPTLQRLYLGAFGLGAAGGQRLWKCLAAPPAAVSDARRERQDRAQEKFARYEKVPPPTGLPGLEVRQSCVCKLVER